MNRNTVLAVSSVIAAVGLAGVVLAGTGGQSTANGDAISEGEAERIAEEAVNGTAHSVTEENEGGSVYEVQVEQADGDVKEVEIDGKTGDVLETEPSDEGLLGGDDAGSGDDQNENR